MQRGIAFAAIALAALVLAYCWLVAIMMASASYPRLITLSSFLAVIMIGNGFLLFGRPRPPRHWLRVLSWLSIVLMIMTPTVLVISVIYEQPT